MLSHLKQCHNKIEHKTQSNFGDKNQKIKGKIKTSVGHGDVIPDRHCCSYHGRSATIYITQ